MTDHAQLQSAAPFALGVLDPPEEASFQSHLDEGCPACSTEVQRYLAALVAPETPVAPGPLRSQLLELSGAPSLPIDVKAYTWAEAAPGIRIAVVKEDLQRGFRACLVWADPGARHGRHVHHGEEILYVMKGGLRDHRAEYHAGEICRSAAGSIHSEEVLHLGECFCYALYYGALEMLAD